MHARRLIVAGTAAAGLLLGTAGTAYAAHDHFIVTGNGDCHQIAMGQTGISDPDAGGYHQFHENVHLGATESVENPNNLGDGHAQTAIYKDACPS